MGLFSQLFSGRVTSEVSSSEGSYNLSRAEEQRIRSILGISSLPSIPAHAVKAFQLASDPDTKVTDFVELLEQDEALTARVIRIANSVYFSRSSRVQELDTAVANIGLDALRGLFSANMLREMLGGSNLARELIWEHSIGTAIASRTLAPHFKCSPGEGFLCGLLHDVGKIILIRQNSDLYKKVVDSALSSGLDFVSWEERLFDVDHVEVGLYLAKQWNFPRVVKQAIAEHHLPEGAKLSPIGELIVTADSLAYVLNSRGLRIANSTIETKRNAAITALQPAGIRGSAFDELCQMINSEICNEKEQFDLK